jgi:hypothetical protein
MKTMLLAAGAALSLGVGSAYADSKGGTIPNNWFITAVPGVAPSLPVRQAPSAVAANQNSGAIHVFVTGHGSTTSLFPPNRGSGGGNGG